MVIEPCIFGNDSLVSSETFPERKFTPPLRLAVLASGNGTNFEALARSIANGHLEAEICVLIVNNSNCEAISRSKRLGIKIKIIDHRHYLNRSSFDEEIIKTLEEFNIELVVMAGWMRIVTEKLINSYPNRLLNIHPSLLPSFKGVNAIEKALKARVKITGCSVHLVTLEVDEGPLLVQSAVRIDELDTLKSLTQKVQSQEHLILPIGVAIAGHKFTLEVEAQG